MGHASIEARFSEFLMVVEAGGRPHHESLRGNCFGFAGRRANDVPVHVIVVAYTVELALAKVLDLVEAGTEVHVLTLTRCRDEIAPGFTVEDLEREWRDSLKILGVVGELLDLPGNELPSVRQQVLKALEQWRGRSAREIRGFWRHGATGNGQRLFQRGALLRRVVRGCPFHLASPRASKAGFATRTTTAGAILEYIGDSNATFGPSGTGQFNPFVRLQGSPTEQGYNTNGTLQFDTKTGNWTKAILVSGIPIVTINGIRYWELFNDINESNTAKHISLNELEIYFTSNANLTGYPFTGTATKEYDFSGSILINDVNQGSGRGDLRYLIPVAGIPIATDAPNCSYGSTTCTTYFVLYSQWGTTSATYNSDGGFEEWKVKRYPVPNTPSIATTLSASTGAIGDTVHDSSALTGATATAGGTVTYTVYTDNLCTLGAQSAGTVTVLNGGVPDSNGIQFNSAGTWYWQATYSGDANNNNSVAVSSTCTSETLVISPNTPVPHSTPVVEIKDTLTVTGFTSDATGSVLVGLYSDACVTRVAGTSDESFAAIGNVGGTLTAATSFVGVTTGTYHYKISYAGDTNNSLFSDCTESVGVTITSLP